MVLGQNTGQHKHQFAHNKRATRGSTDRDDLMFSAADLLRPPGVSGELGVPGALASSDSRGVDSGAPEPGEAGAPPSARPMPRPMVVLGILRGETRDMRMGMPAEGDPAEEGEVPGRVRFSVSTHHNPSQQGRPVESAARHLPAQHVARRRARPAPGGLMLAEAVVDPKGEATTVRAPCSRPGV